MHRDIKKWLDLHHHAVELVDISLAEEIIKALQLRDLKFDKFEELQEKNTGKTFSDKRQ